MRLAIDNQISRLTVDKLRRKFEIVIAVRDEPDEYWVDYALSNGADVFISPDLDIPNLLDHFDSDAAWIDVPQNLRGYRQFDFIMKAIGKLR